MCYNGEWGQRSQAPTSACGCGEPAAAPPKEPWRWIWRWGHTSWRWRPTRWSCAPTCLCSDGNPAAGWPCPATSSSYWRTRSDWRRIIDRIQAAAFWFTTQKQNSQTRPTSFLSSGGSWSERRSSPQRCLSPPSALRTCRPRTERRPTSAARCPAARQHLLINWKDEKKLLQLGHLNRDVTVSTSRTQLVQFLLKTDFRRQLWVFLWLLTSTSHNTGFIHSEWLKKL